MSKRLKASKARVFCIGWHKTGTSTMGMALDKLGYRVLGARVDLAPELLNGNVDKVLEIPENFDVLQDNPWAVLFERLDRKYPDSKFILTTRDKHAWLNSATKHFANTHTPMREWIYGNGVLVGNEELYLARFEKHYADVRSYFNGRDDMIEMDLSSGDAWDKLCKFLDEPIPNIPFPHSNKGKHNLSNRDKIVLGFKNLVPHVFRKWRVVVLEFLGIHKGRNRFNNFQEQQAWNKREK